MIKGIHGLFYSPQAEAARAFIRDKLKLDYVDDGGGWLIFGVPAGGEFGVHPANTPSHQLSFWCDDIDGTVAELENNGVVFNRPVAEEAWGRVTTFDLPGGVEVQLYEPKHAQPS